MNASEITYSVCSNTSESKNYVLERLEVKKHDLEQQLTINEDKLDMIGRSLAKSAKYSEIKKFQNYISDLEKITLLLHSLSRRLTIVENLLKSENEKEILEIKKENLSKQLLEAERIQNLMDKKYNFILEFIEIYLEKETMESCRQLVDMRAELLIKLNDVNYEIKI